MTHNPIPKERSGKPMDSPGGGGPHRYVGTIPVKLLGGKLYYISFTNNKTPYTRVYLLAHKSDALHAYLSFEGWMKMQHGYRIKWLHSNCGREYLSSKFNAHLATHRIEHRLTMHDMLQENGIAEQLNHTLLEKVHSMLHGAQLLKSLWGEALAHTTRLKNWTLTKSLEQATLLQELTGMKLDLSEIHKWGRRVIVYDSTNSKLSG